MSLRGLAKFLGPPYTIHLDPSIQPKQTPCRPVPIHLKETFRKEIDKMLQAGVLKPVTEATPWINSFMLVESKDKSGNHKLRICLDPTNLNKAIIREPYNFKTPEDIAHLIAGACTMTVLDCHKGYWHQQLDEQSSYMTTFNTEFGRYRYTVMPFGTTVAGAVFQCKLDECFGHIPNVIVIADDIMVVGQQPNHKDHDQAPTTLLETSRQCNVRLNYEKLQYKQTEVEFFGDLHCRWVQANQRKGTSHWQDAHTKLQEGGAIFYWDDKIFVKVFSQTHRTCPANKRAFQGESCIHLGPRTPSSFQAGEEWDSCCTYTGILWPKEANSATNWCQHRWAWCLLAPGWEASIFHKQSPNRIPARI